MAFYDTIEALKAELKGYSDDEHRIAELYRSAVKNNQKSYNDSSAQIEAQYEYDRNQAYADNARDERNTMNMLASRGLGFSGEAAQAKLNSNIVLANRLGALARSKNEADAELLKDYNDKDYNLSLEFADRQGEADKNRLGLMADIAALESDKEQHDASLAAEKDMFDRELYAKYHSGKNNGSNGSNGDNGNNSSNGSNGSISELSGFTPDISPKDLAKLMVTNATDDNYIETDDDEYLINRYMLDIYENYGVDDEYMNELVFMLKAYGYDDVSLDELRVQVITRDADEYYKESYKQTVDLYISEGMEENSARTAARQEATRKKLEYIKRRCKSDDEFINCCKQLGIPEQVYGKLLTKKEADPNNAGTSGIPLGTNRVNQIK